MNEACVHKIRNAAIFYKSIIYNYKEAASRIAIRISNRKKVGAEPTKTKQLRLIYDSQLKRISAFEEIVDFLGYLLRAPITNETALVAILELISQRSTIASTVNIAMLHRLAS
jgi:hypothetical protein